MTKQNEQPNSPYLCILLFMLCLFLQGMLWGDDITSGDIVDNLAILKSDWKDDMFIYSGKDWRDNLYLYIKNPSDKDLRFKDIFVEGVRLPIPVQTSNLGKLMGDTNILWADMVPNPIAPGAWAELKIRYRTPSAIKEKIKLKLVQEDGTISEKELAVNDSPSIKFNSYAFDKEFKRLEIYLTASDASEIDIRKVYVSGKDVTAKTTIRNIGISRRFLSVILPEALNRGDYRIVKVVTEKSSSACLVKAIDPFFFIATWGGGLGPECKAGESFSEEWLKDYKSHYINTLHSGWLHDAKKVGGAEKTLDLLARYGLNYCGNRWQNIDPWGGVEKRAKRLGKEPNLVLWEVVDEPCWQCNDEWPSIVLKSWVIPYRTYTEQPTWCSHTWAGIEPRVFGNGHFIYRDFDFVDFPGLYYYPILFGMPPAPASDIEIVGREMEALRLAVAPKPVSFVPQAFPWDMKKRGPTPDEERLMVYMSVAHGARGISYFAYEQVDGEPKGVGIWKTPEAGKLWEEIKNINAELTVLGDLLVRGEILDRWNSGKLEISSILCGDDAIVVVLLNHDYQYDEKCFIPHVSTKPELTVKLPEWFKTNDVFELNAQGLQKLEGNSAQNGTLSFSPGKISTAKVIVISGQKELYENMLARLTLLKNGKSTDAKESK